jgi:arginyl-tRNA synthetase
LEVVVIREQLMEALRVAAEAQGLEAPAEIGLEQPANRDHGDWSSNLAMATAKQAGTNPRELAGQLIERLEAAGIAHVDSIEVAGPGFINFRLADSWLHDVLTATVESGESGYGRNTSGSGTTVNVEFVSANPTGPLHAGHGRGAIYGDALAALLEWNGYDVVRETYINDRGVQMETYAKSLQARAKGEEPAEDGYRGDYITDWAAGMPADLDLDDLVAIREWGYARAKQDQTEVLEKLGIAFDIWFSERTLLTDGRIDAALATLSERGMVMEEDGAVWLKSTEFGDDKDRVLVKSDGDYTYLTPDVAYHAVKFGRSNELINVWGADHHGYIPRMKAAMAALGNDPEKLDVRVTQMVKLMRGTEEVKLSKRSGDLVELRDIVEEVGADATRFTYLLQSVDSQQTFDMEAAASQAMDNPVFYTQYAHARIKSIMTKVAEAGIERQPIASVDLSVLTHERELDVLRQLFAGPGIVALAGRERAPHRVVQWVRDLASAFHGFYHDCYVMGDGVSPEQTQARLWLSEAARIGLASGLSLLGVSAPDSMWTDEDPE